MVVFQWFERIGQTIAPDKNYKQPAEPEPSLLDILAPPSDQAGGGADKDGDSTVRCVHCKNETPVKSPLSPSFQTPTNATSTTSSSSQGPVGSIDDIPEHIRVEMTRAGLETKQVAMQSKNFQERLDAQFKKMPANQLMSGKMIEKFKEILRKDKNLAKEGSLSLRFARFNRLYTTSVPNIPDGYTLLHAAAMYGQLNVVKTLLEDEDFREEQLKRTTCSGESARHVAAIHGQLRVVDFLKQHYPEHETDASGLTMYGNSMISPCNHKKQEFDKYFSPNDPSVLTSGKKHVRQEKWVPLGVNIGFANLSGKRILNEDAHEERVWDENDQLVGFACVCDGHQDGGEVSKRVAEWLPFSLKKHVKVSDWKERLELACGDVDDELKVSQAKNGGSTAIFALLTAQQIIVANVGDSRCILIQRGDSKTQEDLAEAMASLSLDGVGSFTVTPLSNDHLIEGQELERLKKDGASIKQEVYKDANGKKVTKHKLQSKSSLLAMSRAFGDFEFKEVGLTCTPEVVVRDRDFEKDAYLVLACDGIWDVMSNEEVARMIVEQMATKAEITSETLTEVADSIATQCLKSGDNISLLILSLDKLPTSVATPEVLPVVSTVDSPQKA